MPTKPVKTWYRCLVMCTPGHQFDTRRAAILHMYREHGVPIMAAVAHLNAFKVSTDMRGYGRLGQRNLA